MSDQQQPIKEDKISLQTAKNELKKMMDYYEIEIDEIEDQDLKKAIKQGYERLTKAVMKGRLKVSIDDKGITVIQTLKSTGKELKYKEINGEAKMAMAGKQADDYYGKSYALMGSLSEVGESAIKQMKGVDLSLVEVLGMIFLAV